MTQLQEETIYSLALDGWIINSNLCLLTGAVVLVLGELISIFFTDGSFSLFLTKEDLRINKTN